MKIYWRIFHSHQKNLSDSDSARKLANEVQVLFYLQVNIEKALRLAIHYILGDDIIRLLSKTLMANCLVLYCQIEGAQVFKRNRWSPLLSFLSWDTYHPRLLILFINLFQAYNLRDTEFCDDWNLDGVQLA